MSYTTFKNKIILGLKKRWLSLKNITLNEKHQLQKGTVSVIQLELIVRTQRAMLHVVYGYIHIH